MLGPAHYSLQGCLDQPIIPYRGAISDAISDDVGKKKIASLGDDTEKWTNWVPENNFLEFSHCPFIGLLVNQIRKWLFV